MPENTDKRLYLNIFWAALPGLVTVMVAITGGVESFPFPDTAEYLKLGKNLAADFSFEAPGVDLCRRVPGYPFCLMLFAGLGNYAFLAVNVPALSGIAWLGMRLAEKWAIKRPYLLALLLVLSPGIITLTSVPLSETVFSFFLILSIYWLVNDKIFLSGLALSAATCCRPLGILLFLVFTARLIWKKKKALLILSFIVGANLLPLTWTIRNYAKYGRPVFTTLSGFNLLYYKAGSYLSWKNNIPFDTMRNELGEQLQGNDIFEQSAAAGKLGRRILLDNFWGFCCWAPRDMVYFLMPDLTPLLERLHLTAGNRGTLDILRRQGLRAAFQHYFNGHTGAMIAMFIYLCFYCLVFAAIIAGIIRLGLNKHYPALIFGTLLIAYFWILPVGNLDWRFRMPVMPLLFILALYGLSGSKINHEIHEKGSVKNNMKKGGCNASVIQRPKTLVAHLQ
ncbi:MAG: hypothetical protein PHH77_11470 [Victivallaceae bacterium]|nr:hypothetical protein [Victivallaceae bacterium]